jgi:putative Mg2+ transporter-C (MgtC) family protein
VASFWEPFASAVSSIFSDLPTLRTTANLLVLILLAIGLGGILGWQREVAGKAAGLRTHMLVCLGAALFVGGPRLAGMDDDALSRIIQGLTTGIGFIGAGTILKAESPTRVYGLTTAAGIWMTAAIGVGIGLGRGSTAVLATAAAFLILWMIPGEQQPPTKPHEKAT